MQQTSFKRSPLWHTSLPSNRVYVNHKQLANNINTPNCICFKQERKFCVFLTTRSTYYGLEKLAVWVSGINYAVCEIVIVYQHSCKITWWWSQNGPETCRWILTLSDPTSDLVQQYDFPVLLRCRKTSDTIFVAFVRPLSEPVRHFSSCSTGFNQQIAQVVLFLYLHVFSLSKL
jgi:hypothetical protein